VKAVVTSKVPCKLQGGELRRVPQNPRGWVVGYHVSCPRCGFVTLAVAGRKDLAITEDNGRVTFSRPLRCTYCQVLIRIERGELTLEEDDRVRRVRYR
jgi:hypothetical protein